MAIKTKQVEIKGWQISVNENSIVLSSDAELVGFTNPNDRTDVLLISLNDNEVSIGQLYYGAKVKVSLDKKITIEFDEEID